MKIKKIRKLLYSFRGSVQYPEIIHYTIGELLSSNMGNPDFSNEEKDELLELSCKHLQAAVSIPGLPDYLRTMAKSKISSLRWILNGNPTLDKDTQLSVTIEEIAKNGKL